MRRLRPSDLLVTANVAVLGLASLALFGDAGTAALASQGYRSQDSRQTQDSFPNAATRQVMANEVLEDIRAELRAMRGAIERGVAVEVSNFDEGVIDYDRLAEVLGRHMNRAGGSVRSAGTAGAVDASGTAPAVSEPDASAPAAGGGSSSATIKQTGSVRKDDDAGGK